MAFAAAGLALIAACAAPTAAPGLSGAIEIDGSSTVFPITEAVAEEFRKVHPNVRVNAGVSGTGGGFKRFTAGEIAIADASRPIKPSEAALAERNGIEWLELPVALDGLVVVINHQNTFVTCLTTAELKRIWEPGSQVRAWHDVRPEFPSQPLRLYGPGTDSGTFDYFTEAIVGKEDASRSDYTASEDDNVLVQGIAGDRNALGYFGYAYYAENPTAMNLVGVDGGSGCVLPSHQTVRDGTYQPLARPLFIYVNRKELREQAELQAFIQFYLEQAPSLATEVGYIPAAEAVYQEGVARVKAALARP